MIGDLLLSVVGVIIIEAMLGGRRKRREVEARAAAYLRGVRDANRLRMILDEMPPKSDARH